MADILYQEKLLSLLQYKQWKLKLTFPLFTG